MLVQTYILIVKLFFYHFYVKILLTNFYNTFYLYLIQIFLAMQTFEVKIYFKQYTKDTQCEIKMYFMLSLSVDT